MGEHLVILIFDEWIRSQWTECELLFVEGVEGGNVEREAGLGIV